MRESRFSMNRLLVIVIFISAITFFITVKLSQTALKTWPTNVFNRIENSEYAVKYSNLEPNGIYKGNENVNTLIVKGNFGYDWGVALIDNDVYTNEYSSTDLGLVLCNVVKIDLNSGKKTVLIKDAILRGRCASGELVILKGFASQSNHPETNSLCKLYSFTSDIKFNSNSELIYYDAQKGKAVFSVEAKSVSEKVFDKMYIDRTLQEVRG